MSALCGTNRGYRHHLERNEVTCRACCDEHARTQDKARKRRQARAIELMGRYVPHREVAHVLGNYGP